MSICVDCYHLVIRHGDDGCLVILTDDTICGCMNRFGPGDPCADRVTRAEAELARWHAKCDEVGIPHDPDTLVRHHRANAGLAAAFDREAEVFRLRQFLTHARASARAWKTRADVIENRADHLSRMLGQSEADVRVLTRQVEVYEDPKSARDREQPSELRQLFGPNGEAR